MSRSLLFIPGNNPSMIQNSDLYGADAVIFDLEDSVLVEHKDAARDLVKTYLEQLNLLTCHVIVRINGMETPFLKLDLEALAYDYVDAFMIPNATHGAIEYITNQIKELEQTRELKKEIQLIPIIETPYALLQVKEIVKMDRVTGLLFGAEDYTTNMSIKRTKQGKEILFARNMISIAAKAYNKEAYDTPFTDVSDFDGLKEDIKLAKRLGFSGKAAIHPRQIDSINELFSPSKEDILDAQRILKQAKKETKGAFSIDGKMIDTPIITRAQKVINQAKLYGLIGQTND
ncbi:MAG: CoA ester lyase [Acholeplasmataceae bacterium]